MYISDVNSVSLRSNNQLWSNFPKLTQSNSCHMSDLNSIIIYNPNVCVHSSGCQHSVDMARICITHRKKYVTASMHKHNRITYRHNAHFHGLSEFWKNGSTNVIENVCAEQ